MNFKRNVSIGWIAACCVCGAVRAENSAALNDVLKLKRAGVSDDTIVAFVQSRNLAYDLSADSVLRLREQGLASAVLNAMLASGKGLAVPPPPTASPSAPAAPPAPPATAPPFNPAPPAGAFSPPAPPLSPAVVLPAAVAPPGPNPDVAYFYQELSPYGRWIRVEDGPWCWQPTLVVNTPAWRPYRDKGRWVWTDHGWYWTSDYPWGWAAFHYGRWQLHPHHGWIWFPDRVWGPAWVVWRSGGDYCGWAPLPPGVVCDLEGGRLLFHGRRVEAGFDFGLGPAHFSFAYRRELGAPLRAHFRGEPEIRDIFRRTTVLNHYSFTRTVVGGETRVQVINHGLEPSAIGAGNGRHVAVVQIRDLNAPAPGRAHERLDARARTLEAYRPRFGGQP